VNKYTFCHKPGHPIEKGFTKFTALKTPINQQSNGKGQNQILNKRIITNFSKRRTK
jgi:hypothetical protein